MKIKNSLKKPLDFKKLYVKAGPFFTVMKAIFIALIIGAIIMAFIGANPITVYKNIFIDPFSSTRHTGNIIGGMSWMIPVGLSFAVAFKTGLFNIGMSGQMLFAGTIGVMMGIDGHPLILIVPVMLIAGAALGALTGFLKAQFNVHEVVSSIMLNWIVYNLYIHLIVSGSDYRDGSANSKNPVAGSNFVSETLSKLFPESTGINTVIFISIILAIAVWAFFKFTKIGFKLKATGFNSSSAKAAGYNTKLNTIISFAIAGAISAIAAMALYLGVQNMINNMQMPPLEGFDGITVALVGMNNPIGIIFSAFFVSLFQIGKTIPPTEVISGEMLGVIYAIILIAIASSTILKTPIKEVVSKIKNRRAK